MSPRLESVRRSILGHHADQVNHLLGAEPNSFSVVNPAIAARCLVGAVYESLYTWLEQNPEQRLPAVEVARAVADYNTRALRAH